MCHPLRHPVKSFARAVAVVLWLCASANEANAQTAWTITDLGTLGGDSANAEDINDAGHVVGGSQTTTGDVHAFLWTPSDGLLDLGTLGGARSEAFGINNTGQVVGNSMPADPVDPFPPAHAFLWTADGGMIDLGYLGELFPGFGRGSSGASDINDSGQVVGSTSIGNGDTHAFLWTEDGGMVDLGTLGGANSHAFAINDAGQIVGRSETASGEEHAFLWTAATGMVDLGTLGGVSSSASDINASGVVVGRAATASGDEHAFLWTEAVGMVDLGSPGGPGTRSQAEGINDNGEVVGLWNDGDDFAFYWTETDGIVELPTLTGIESGARAINNAGQAAGYGDIDTGDGRAVIWIQDDGTPTAEEQIEALEAAVQALVSSGSLRPRQALGLLRPLRSALRSLERGNVAAACAHMEDFQAEVTGMVSDGVLTAEEAAPLIDSAASIRIALGC